MCLRRLARKFEKVSVMFQGVALAAAETRSLRRSAESRNVARAAYFKTSCCLRLRMKTNSKLHVGDRRNAPGRTLGVRIVFIFVCT